ncbi:MAG: lytic transglycosylase domain-containing protein [Verrucomicrobia subdivision 3 bacterium]|nr:lytic transglycosylase domain-containing protein [Limisphaerales bacterium]
MHLFSSVWPQNRNRSVTGLTTPGFTLSGFLALLLVLPCARAQDQPFVLEDLAPGIEEWARENIDEDVLKALGGADQERIRSFLSDLNRTLQNDSVYDLGALKDGATTLLPLLEGMEETRPYASWLKTHLDYFDVADDWRRSQPRPKPGAPAVNPTVENQREAWERQIKGRSLPPRAQKYVPRLKPIFVAQGTPGALVWLGEVESSFDPGARSPAGAAGMFQFMPVTAQSQGLSVSPRDERMDPEKSAHAAAKYLRHLYNRFGDWRLALAAYNAGETRVDTLLTRYKARSYSAIAGRLPAETQMYIPKIEATLRRREGTGLAGLQLP